jgi:16S rRNA processing protein RimM
MGKEFLAIGRLGAPKGVRGDLKVQSYSGETAHFRGLKEVDLRSAGTGEADPAAGAKSMKLKVLRIDEGPGGLTMAFVGYSSPEAARVLTGLEIVAPRSAAAPLKPDEYYVIDLIGLALVHEGRRMGIVRSVLEGGPDPWLEIAKAEAPAPKAAPIAVGGDKGGLAKRPVVVYPLVPFRKEFVGEVDLEAGTIELLVPELLEE